MPTTTDGLATPSCEGELGKCCPGEEEVHSPQILYPRILYPQILDHTVRDRVAFCDLGEQLVVGPTGGKLQGCRS